MATLTPLDLSDLSKVDASPTKAFFVDIITKDIKLDEAIQDLVDNCIDGAKRLRDHKSGVYDDLRIDIVVNGTEFRINDNCGGIPLDTARLYAFKFGRAVGFKTTDRSVGQFGVGMKRALFKMGPKFSVLSTEPNHRFHIDVDVPIWAADDVNWDFTISDLETKPFAEKDCGTEIHVSELDPSVATTFGQKWFEINLRNDLRIIHQDPMRKGLAISLNGVAIIPSAWQLKDGNGLGAAARTYTDDLGGQSPLVTRLYVGVGDPNRASAGWYVFCNGRCILEADQDDTTGWNDVSESGIGIPKYHGQFARFRGYAFLDSDDSSILPWNTTKTGLDLESDAYRRLRGRLIEAARPVIDFLNALDAEKDLEEPDRAITKSLAAAVSRPLEKLEPRLAFTYTAPPAPRGPALVSISYKRPAREVSALKDALTASSNREVGEKSFQYALDNLIEED